MTSATVKNLCAPQQQCMSLCLHMSMYQQQLLLQPACTAAPGQPGKAESCCQSQGLFQL
jgi:hypothetical protein